MTQSPPQVRVRCLPPLRNDEFFANLSLFLNVKQWLQQLREQRDLTRFVPFIVFSLRACDVDSLPLPVDVLPSQGKRF